MNMKRTKRTITKNKKNLAVGLGSVGAAALAIILYKNREPDFEAYATAADTAGLSGDDLLTELSGCSTCGFSNLVVDTGGSKVTADNILLTSDYDAALSALESKYPGAVADGYIGKMEHALKDALADAANKGGNPEDTTAYRHFQGMGMVMQSYDTAVDAGLSNGWDTFKSGCCGNQYQHLVNPIIKIVDGYIVSVPGSRVKDVETGEYLVWDEWGGHARWATPTETMAYVKTENMVTDPGESEFIAPMRNALHHQLSASVYLSNLYGYLEDVQNGTASYNDIMLHGSEEYLLDHIATQEAILAQGIADYAAAVADAEAEGLLPTGGDFMETPIVPVTPPEMIPYSPVSSADPDPQVDTGGMSYTEYVKSNELPTVKLPSGYYGRKKSTGGSSDDDDDDGGWSAQDSSDAAERRASIPDYLF